MNIFVGNLPFRTSESNLQETMEQYGTVSRVQIITDRETGRSKGFAFVEMPEQSEAEACIEALNGHNLDGRPLRVNEAQPREDRPRRDRGGGGNYRRNNRN
jgi:RNA recognition motif-containing protein